MEGRLGVNWAFFAKQFGSWVATLFVSGLFTAALFAQGLFAPNKFSGAQVTFYEDSVSSIAAVSDYNMPGACHWHGILCGWDASVHTPQPCVHAHHQWGDCVTLLNVVPFPVDSSAAALQAMLNNYRTSLLSYQEAADAGVIPRLPAATLTAWADKLNATATKAKAVSTTATGERAACVCVCGGGGLLPQCN
jgi:hypothetical protein